MQRYSTEKEQETEATAAPEADLESDELIMDHAKHLFDQGLKKEALQYLSQKFQELEQHKKLIIASWKSPTEWHEDDVKPVLEQQASICNNMGFIFESMGDNDKALKMYVKGSELNPQDDVLLANAGVVFHKSGKLDQAAAMYRKSLQIDPSNVPCRFRLAQILFYHEKNLEKAKKELQRCVNEEPHFLPAYGDLARILSQNGKPEDQEEALRLCQFMIDNRQDMNDLDGYYAKAFILSHHMKRYQDAIDTYERAFELVGKQQEAGFEIDIQEFIVPVMNLAMLYERMDNMEKALFYASRAYDLDRSNPDVVFLLQRVLERIGRAEEAEHLLREMLRADDRNDMVYSSLVSLLLRQKRVRGAQEVVDQGRRTHPQMSKVWNTLDKMIRENAQ